MSDHSPLIADGDQYDSAPGIVHSLSEPCGGNIANHKHTLKKIWRRPSLHRDTHPAPAEAQIRKDDSELETTHSTHRSEIWYELFYDLIYVASATQLSKLVEHDLSLFGLFQSTLLFVVLRSNWEQLMFYQVCAKSIAFNPLSYSEDIFFNVLCCRIDLIQKIFYTMHFTCLKPSARF